MKKSKKILLKWAATYGEDESDVKASMYNEDMMIEFAKYYHKQKITLTDVSDMLILTPKDAELFFNEVMNPKKANEALKKAMLKFITR
jgi:hypothetical protein